MSPAILVASPRQIGSMPVASGSRLPTWPALSARSMRLVFCRAALDDKPDGLSRSRIPVLGLAVFRLAVLVGLALAGPAFPDWRASRGLVFARGLRTRWVR